MWHIGEKSGTTSQKTRPVFTIARGRDRSEPAAAGPVTEGEEWNVEGRRRAAQKYLRDSLTDHRSHGSDATAAAASPQAAERETYATFAYEAKLNVKMPVKTPVRLLEQKCVL